MNASGFRVFCGATLLVVIAFLYVGYENAQADRLGAELCARARPGALASELTSYAASKFENVHVAESAGALYLVARGVFVHKAICQVTLEKGIVLSASLELHD